MNKCDLCDNKTENKPQGIIGFKPYITCDECEKLLNDADNYAANLPTWD
jgi:hypothetical protein